MLGRLVHLSRGGFLGELAPATPPAPPPPNQPKCSWKKYAPMPRGRPHRYSIIMLPGLKKHEKYLCSCGG